MRSGRSVFAKAEKSWRASRHTAAEAELGVRLPPGARSIRKNRLASKPSGSCVAPGREQTDGSVSPEGSITTLTGADPDPIGICTDTGGGSSRAGISRPGPFLLRRYAQYTSQRTESKTTATSHSPKLIRVPSVQSCSGRMPRSSFSLTGVNPAASRFAAACPH
jgi:hypothetical protein